MIAAPNTAYNVLLDDAYELAKDDVLTKKQIDDCQVSPHDTAEDIDYKQNRLQKIIAGCHANRQRDKEKLAAARISKPKDKVDTSSPRFAALNELLAKLHTLSYEQKKSGCATVDIQATEYRGKLSIHNFDENIQYTLWQFARERFHFAESLAEGFAAHTEHVIADLQGDNLTLEDFYSAGGYLLWLLKSSDYFPTAWRATSVGPAMVYVYPPLFEKGGAYTFRAKPWHPRKNDVGEVVAKYESPPGCHVSPYFPHGLTGLESRGIASSKELAITEGEKNCLAGLKAGIPVIGIPGVFCFFDPHKELKVLHPSLVKVISDYKVETVYICFDSDYSTNEQVRNAVEALCICLSIYGVAGKVCIPLPESHDKVGLGNYLARGGNWEELKSSATVHEPHVFTNAVEVVSKDPRDKRKVYVPKKGRVLVAEVQKIIPGWHSVGESSPVLIRERPHPIRSRAIDKADAFVAELRMHHEAHFYPGSGCITPQQLLLQLEQTVPNYSFSFPFPIWPRDDKAYCDLPCSWEEIMRRVKEVEQLPLELQLHSHDEFLKFFPFESELDKLVCRIMRITAHAGLPPGKKPAVMFAADKPGNAKTDTQFAILRSIGGDNCWLDMNHADDGGGGTLKSNYIAEAKRKWVNADAATDPFGSLDNIKGGNFGGEALESFITSPQITGWRIYRGKCTVPNRTMLWLNFNNPDFTADMARRVVSIWLKMTPEHMKKYMGYDDEIKAYLGEHTLDLWAESLAFLRRDKRYYEEPRLKWSFWESSVLWKDERAKDIAEYILRRMGEVDTSKKEGSNFHAWIMKEVVELISLREGRPSNLRGTKDCAGILIMPSAMNSAWMEEHKDCRSGKKAQSVIERALNADIANGRKNIHYVGREGRMSWFAGYVAHWDEEVDASAIKIPSSYDDAKHKFLICRSYKYQREPGCSEWITNEFFAEC